jgi:hypothetical protein
MLIFTKTKNTRLPDSVHNAGVTLQSRDIPHTLPSPIFYERARGFHQTGDHRYGFDLWLHPWKFRAIVHSF